MNEAKKVSELPVLLQPNANTMFVVDHYNSNTGTSNTYTVTLSLVDQSLNNIHFQSVNTDIIPAQNSVFSLGNSSLQWKSLYVSTNTIYIGGTPLSITNGSLTVNGGIVVTNVVTSNSSATSLIANQEQWSFNSNGVLSIPGRITWGQTQYNGPSLSNKSGERLTLWDQGNTFFSYSIGIEQDAMWFGVDTGNSDKGFRWYSGNSVLMDVTRSGKVIVTNDIVPASDNTYSLGNSSHQWKSIYVSSNTIYIDRVPLSSNNGSITSNSFITSSITTTAVYDELKRPVYNLNALDINADGGVAAAVFNLSDSMFDGGATTTVFNLYEASLDGGASFNNKHSASYIDGGGASVI